MDMWYCRFESQLFLGSVNLRRRDRNVFLAVVFIKRNALSSTNLPLHCLFHHAAMHHLKVGVLAQSHVASR